MDRLRAIFFLLPFSALLVTAPVLAVDGSVVKIDATNSAAETVERLKELIVEKRFKVFSVVNHGDQQSAKKVISFGKTSHHARIMWHDSAAGLELPLKIAVLQDDVGTQVVYRKPTSLRDSYRVDSCALLDELDLVVADLAHKAAQ